MKKAISFILCAALVIALQNTLALSDGDFQFAVTAENTAVITRYTGTEPEPEIPGMLEGYSVTMIGEGAFRDNETLVTAHLPDSVEVIGAQAFYNCPALRDLTLPSSLREIGDFAFAYCTALPFVEIPEGTLQIGEYAFGDCAALTAAVLPASVSRIGPEAFLAAAAGFGLYGHEGSAAQRYALEYSLPFGRPEEAPSLELTASARKETSQSQPGDPNQDDEPEAWFPAPQTLNGLWLVTTTYESWYGEDGVEKAWNLTWSSPFLLELKQDGQGTWTHMHPLGAMPGPASCENGALSGSYHANGPVQYEGQVIIDGSKVSLAGRMIEESHTDTLTWVKGPWTAIKVSEPAEIMGYRELKEGSRGKDVAALKTRLFQLGYFRSDPGSDYFTDKTAEAVKAFEKANSLIADGVADQVTQALFYSQYAKPKPK